MENAEIAKNGQMAESSDALSLIFKLMMSWRIFYGICKVFLALALLEWFKVDTANLFHRLMAHELIEDPNDILIRIANPVVTHLTVGTTVFIAVYLLFWGIVDDIFLSVNILRRKLWAFPLALILIAIFVPYEMYRLMHTHSFILGCIICVDVIIFWLIAKEYRKQKRRYKLE